MDPALKPSGFTSSQIGSDDLKHYCHAVPPTQLTGCSSQSDHGLFSHDPANSAMIGESVAGQADEPVPRNCPQEIPQSFTHGICAATKKPFRMPQELRQIGQNPGLWEGLCEDCNKWVRVGGKSVGTAWFRHKHKVRNHLVHFSVSFADRNSATPGKIPEVIQNIIARDVVERSGSG